VFGQCNGAGGYGVAAENTAGGVALNVVGKMSISSTVNVANLNASSLNGATFASPGNIGGTTPGVVTTTNPVPDTNKTRDIADSSHYFNFGYIAQPVGGKHWFYDNGTANQTVATWSTFDVCTGHSATASDYYGGSVPTNGAIVFPCFKFNLHGVVVGLVDAHGVYYNSTNW
jgi:hypothetical protein